MVRKKIAGNNKIRVNLPMKKDKRKISETAKIVGKHIAKQGFITTVYVDKQGEPVLVSAWWPELIVSKIDLKE